MPPQKRQKRFKFSPDNWPGGTWRLRPDDEGEWVRYKDLQATQERVRELEHDLAQCYRLTGSDPDGDSDSHLAKDAVGAVRELREERDQAEEKFEKTDARYVQARGEMLEEEGRRRRLERVIDEAVEEFERRGAADDSTLTTDRQGWKDAAAYLRDRLAELRS